MLDAGAVRVLRHGGKSLLPVGVTATRGKFARGEVVLCLDPESGAVAKGLVNYSSDETAEDPRLRDPGHRGAARLYAGARADAPGQPGAALIRLSPPGL